MKEAPQPTEKEAPQAEAEGEPAPQAAGDARVHRQRERRWAAADEYNRQHPEEVAEFNRLTGNACAGEEGAVDVQKLRAWQSDHGVITDGKIGPKTLAAAKPKDAANDAKVEKPKDPKQAAAAKNVPFLSQEMLERAIHQIDLFLAKAEVKAADPKPIDAEGLASPLSLSEFVAAAAQVRTQWEQLSPKVRGGKLIEAANEQLVAAGAVRVDWGLLPLPSEIGGKFVHKDWKVNLNLTLFSRDRLSKEEANQLGATTYHETRHAEQHFRVARLLAGQGKSVDEIVASTKMPAKVVEAAAKQPIKEGDPGAKSAAAFANATVGEGKAERQKALSEAEVILQQYKDLQTELEAMQKNPKADPDRMRALEEQVEAMKPTVARAWAAYERVATENDALGVEAAVKQSMK